MDKPTEQRLLNTVYGNGQPGLVKDNETTKAKLTDMCEDLRTLSEAYVDLAKSQTERDAIEQANIDFKEKKHKTIKDLSIIATLVGGFVLSLKEVLDFIANIKV
jgi:hypothetical protein